MMMVFGSIDITVSVQAARLPLPGEWLGGGERHLRPGGRGAGVALAAQRFGVPTQMVGAVGDDVFGELALDRLRLAGVDLRRVRHLAGQATGLCSTVSVAGGTPTTVFAPGANAAVRSHWVADDELGSCRTLLVDLALPLGQSLALASRARHVGCRTLLVAAPWTRQTVTPAVFDWAVTDIAGLRHATGDAAWPTEPANWVRPAQRLAAQLGCRLLLYLAGAGAWTVQADGVRQRRAGLGRAFADTPAAFEVFAGVFAAALNQGLAEHRAVDHALAAAALAAPADGAPAAAPDRCSIEDALLRAAGAQPPLLCRTTSSVGSSTEWRAAPPS